MFNQSPEAAVVQLFEEVKRHKPSVIYIPDINTWYSTLADSVIRTFVGLLRGLRPTDPILLLGVMDEEICEDKASDATKEMIRAMFGYSKSNVYSLPRISVAARKEYFQGVIDLVRKAPTELPERDERKKRKLDVLPVAPPIEMPKGPSKEELKAQKKKDRLTLNILKLQIQSVMDQIKLKYKKFRTPVVDESLIRYLFDEQDPEVLTTDLNEEQRQQQLLFRPFEIEKDHKGVAGLREVASGKFYYNLEIVTIEKRLSNGYYKRPKDFLADINRLVKDAKTVGDNDRILKGNEMLANVQVDVWMIEQNQVSFVAECEAVYEREQERERERLRKVAEQQRQGENVPKVVPNLPPLFGSKTTTDDSGPIVLGQEFPGRQPVPPFTPSRVPVAPSSLSDPWSTTNGSHPSHHTNGSTVPSRPREDTEMTDAHAVEQRANTQPAFSQTNTNTQPPLSQALSNTQAGLSQRTAHTHITPGSQLAQYHNSASTTTSGNKTNRSSDRQSLNSHQGHHFQPGDHADFSMLAPGEQSVHEATGSESHYPDTQDPSILSQLSQPIPPRVAPRPSHSGPAIENLLNAPESPRGRGNSRPTEGANGSSGGENGNNGDNDEDEEDASAPKDLVLDLVALDKIHDELVRRTSGLSLDQLEQVNATLMNVVWRLRTQWNRIVVGVEVQKASTLR